MSFPPLIGCIAAQDAGGGAVIPASIIARENLAHWWKLDEGDTSAAKDYGLSASSTDMTLTGASNAAGDGPTEIGSPDVISFSGGLGEVKARDAGSDTPLGTLFATDNFTLTWWMKDATVSYSQLATWVACVATSASWTSGGFGIYYSYYSMYPWEGAHNAGGTAGSWGGAGSWRHHAIRFNGAGGKLQHLLNGTQNMSLNVTINTDVSAATNAYFTLAGVKDPGGTITNQTSPKMSDVRLYDSVLTDANISDIADGDWT
jgi:hypothetical protein